MVVWGLRITTFITNMAVIVAFGVLYTWLQQGHSEDKFVVRWRPWLQIAALWTVLIIFHFASVWGRAEAVTPVGYGWNYLNFQAAAMVYALLSGRNRRLLWSLIILMTLWYHFLADVPLSMWPPIAALTIITMALGNRFWTPLGDHWYYYAPYTLVFILPLMYANWISIKNIDVGLLWQFGTLFATIACLGALHRMLVNRKVREVRLMREGQIDDLTRLHNFRMFDADLNKAYQDMLLTGAKIALFTFDIDHFKRINDRYGHLVGNTVLETVARRLDEITANTDYTVKTYRTGGEEFTFMLFDITVDFDRSAQFARLIKDEMAKLHFTTAKGETFSITISLGEDHSRYDDQNYLDVYNRADKYLYDSKNHGRNTITLCGITID